MASLWRSRGSEAEDGRFDDVRCRVVEVRPKYPSLTVIFFSPQKYFNLLIGLINRTGGSGLLVTSLIFHFASYSLGIVRVSQILEKIMFLIIK
jgi:hypothetical protein